MTRIPIRTLIVMVLVAVAISACGPRSEEAYESPEPVAETAMEQMADERPDTTGASLWAYLQETNYQESWTLWPDKGELYSGQEPHGMLLTSYLNDAALNALNDTVSSMPDAAIIVKENYMPDSTLAAVTVMYKVDGYNPEHNDWFFSKFLPTGELDTGPNDMALEGRVPGCQSCHGQKKDNDYIFTEVLEE